MKNLMLNEFLQIRRTLYNYSERKNVFRLFYKVWKKISLQIPERYLGQIAGSISKNAGLCQKNNLQLNGYAYEAAKAVISWGFNELELKRIECTAFVNNNQSNRVCEKLGLDFECVRKKGYMLYDGTIHDISCYAITDDEYFKSIRN